MVVLAIAATAAVQAGMWGRYNYLEAKAESKLPPGVAAEMRRLEIEPEKNAKRLQEIYAMYGEIFAPPSDTEDLIVQALLSLAIVPFVVAFGLILARRIVRPVSHAVSYTHLTLPTNREV